MLLQGEPVLRDDAEAAAGRRDANAEYARIGWLNRRGQIDGHVLDTLSVLAYPGTEYYGWFQYHAGTNSALVACGESEAVLVYRSNDTLAVASLRPNESPTNALVREFPDHPPARIDAVNMRLADLDPDTTWLAEAWARGDVRKLRAYGDQETIGQGELWVAVRDRHRVRRVFPQPVRYRDTRAGRMLVSFPNGYVSVAPASKELLRGRLERAYLDLIN